MPTSDPGRVDRRVLAALLLAANALLFAAWPWLRALPLGTDSTDPIWKTFGEGPSVRRHLIAESLLRNTGYLASFMDAVRKDRAVLFWGTSETLPNFNLGVQLNALHPDDPPMAVLAKSGTSPIHAAFVFANCKASGIAIPPLVVLINPVYFTESHDVINDGWLSLVMRSEVFVQLDHRGVLERLTPAVRQAYAQHFGLRRYLLPLYAQEYLGNLAYLAFHQSAHRDYPVSALPVWKHEFNGKTPDYDRERGVHPGYRALDARYRWEVRKVGDSVNLMGLQAMVATLATERAPVLLLVLPVNRRFYESNGIDMEDFDNRYRDLRRAFGDLQRPGHVFLLDLFDAPWLDYGFGDRMHEDEYGFHQIAEHVASAPSYRSFIDAVRAYYAGPAR